MSLCMLSFNGDLKMAKHYTWEMIIGKGYLKLLGKFSEKFGSLMLMHKV